MPFQSRGGTSGMPWRSSLVLAGGSLVIGAVSPLYDSYVPPLLQRHLSSSGWIGAAMGIDNVLALLLVPLIGALSDGTRSRLGRRVPFVLVALPITAIGVAVIPLAERFGLMALLAAMIALDISLAVWRAPFSALLSELVPSIHRSKTEGILGVSMCIGAMVMLGSARSLGARSSALPFLLAGLIVAAVWVVQGFLLREPPHDREAHPSAAAAVIAPFRSLRDAFTAGGGRAPQFFAACLLFQMAFQSFSSWFTLHASERFQTSIGNASLGFIAVAISTLVGSMPAGWLGARFGRRRMSLVGIAGMAIACVLLHLVPTLTMAVVVLFLFGVSWSFPVANLTPMALELGTAARAGSLAGAFLLVQSAAGIIGPSIVGIWFDVMGTKRALFVLLTVFLSGAFVLFAKLAPGFGEAEIASSPLGARGHRSSRSLRGGVHGGTSAGQVTDRRGTRTSVNPLPDAPP